MRIIKKLFVALLLIGSIQAASAQSFGDLLKGIAGGGSATDIISNVIEGVFTKTDLTLADLVGEYKSEGPAVTFKSENFLQKAGGIAGAAAIESKLKPYYDKYGLNGMTLTIDSDANFTMKVKGVPLSGTITKNDKDGTFTFNFKAVVVNIGKLTAYIEKSGSNLNLMFDATKLKSLISTITKITGNSLASTVGSILDSYDGACIGFKMVSTSSSSNNTNTTTTTTTTTPSDSTQNSTTNTVITNGINALKGIFKNK